MTPRSRALAVGAATALSLLAPAAGAADLVAAEPVTKYYVIAIGNNASPTGGPNRDLDPDLATLRFADDDAGAVTRFFDELGAETALLTVMDAESQRRFPELVPRARPPSLVELHRAVAGFAAALAQDKERGVETNLVFFFSGHGVRASGDQPSFLNLLDGPLTQAILYDEVLAALPAKVVHVIIDACHAESIVRARDGTVAMDDVTAADIAEYRARWTLNRFPNVGAIVAATIATQAHEWDRYRMGVFTHEVLSGLRGAADVSQDGRVEYSELEAFLGAANHRVEDPRARLQVVMRPPAINVRVAIVDLKAHREGATLTGLTGSFGRVYVEDEHGNPLLEMFAEEAFAPGLAVPAGLPLFVRSRLGELSLTARRGQRVALHAAEFHRAAVVSRGAIASALARGLFTIPFGPLYYRGYVDARPDLLPATLLASPVTEEPAMVTRSWAGLGTPAALAFLMAAASAAVTVGYSLDALSARQAYDRTAFERPATAQKDRFERARTIAILAGVGAGLAAGGGLYLELGRRRAAGATRVGALASAALTGLVLEHDW